MEIEMKYLLRDREQADEILNDELVKSVEDEGSFESIDMLAIYYDTPDRALTAEGIAVRVRREGDYYVATMKDKGNSIEGMHKRKEINVRLSDEEMIHHPDVTIFSESDAYEQLLDITEAIEENENEIFDDDNLIYIMNISNKISRLKEDTDSLSSSVNHLQDAYSSSLDIKLNNVMKRFTVITSIFFPLTLIVGWYGMNFKAMPEFDWKYGYIFVIALSVCVVSVLMIIGKKKKWF